jgi:hypothetical protein
MEPHPTTFSHEKKDRRGGLTMKKSSAVGVDVLKVETYESA